MTLSWIGDPEDLQGLACEMLRVVVFEYRLCVVAKSVGRPSLEGLVDRPTLAVGLFRWCRACDRHVSARVNRHDGARE